MRRTIPVVIATVALFLAGCTASAPEIPDVNAAANALVTGLQTGSLAEVNLRAEPAANPQTQLEQVLQPLLDASGQAHPQLILGDVVTSEPAESGDDTPPTATAALHWTWPFGEANDWRYDTTANFVYVPPADGAQPTPSDWQLVWQPDILVPDFAPGTEISFQRTEPQRADILDGSGEPLVTMRPVYRLGIDKSAVVGSEHYDEAQLDESARQLVALVAASGYTYDPDAYVARVNAAGPRAFVDLITIRQDDETIDLAAAQQIPAVSAVPGTLPLAPTSTFARAILGRAGEATAELIEQSDGRLRAGDIAGLSGLQKQYDLQLAGSPGLRVVATSADGAETVLYEQEAADGQPLETTFDVGLQNRAEAILATVEPAAAIVAIRPSTGEILAAASGPGSQGQDTALLGQFAPGSTFKLVDALALNRHGITAASIVPCTPDIEVDGRTFSNVPEYPADALGDIPLRTAFAHSCNTAFIAEADTVTPADLATAAGDLGFELPTPIGTAAFYGEVPEAADPVEHAAALLGQGRVLASPFAMARATASIAAGHRVDPYLLRRESSDTGISGLTEPEAAAIRELMAAVVAEGSATMLQDVPGIGGAKTGTAQFGDGSQNHAWMIAFTDDTGPDGDLAVAVFVEQGERGATTSGPLMREFLLGDG